MYNLKYCAFYAYFRYYDAGTPNSSLSPASSSCLQSPCSFTLDSPSPPPTTADFCEFFQASSSLFEKDFSNLTLSGEYHWFNKLYSIWREIETVCCFWCYKEWRAEEKFIVEIRVVPVMGITTITLWKQDISRKEKIQAEKKNHTQTLHSVMSCFSIDQKYYTSYVLGCLVIEMHVTIECYKLANYQTVYRGP